MEGDSLRRPQKSKKNHSWILIILILGNYSAFRYLTVFCRLYRLVCECAFKRKMTSSQKYTISWYLFWKSIFIFKNLCFYNIFFNFHLFIMNIFWICRWIAPSKIIYPIVGPRISVHFFICLRLKGPSINYVVLVKPQRRFTK